MNRHRRATWTTLAGLSAAVILLAGQSQAADGGLRPECWKNEGLLLGADVSPFWSFGLSVAIGDDTSAVGAPDMIVDGVRTGGAYIFARQGKIWVEEFKIEPDDGNKDDELGWSVAASGDLALAGTRSGLVGNQVHQGAVYAFARSDGIWRQTQKLLASDGDEQDRFGTATALDGDTLLVGAGSKDIAGQKQGAVYVFTLVGDQWVEQAKLFDPDGEMSDGFGGTLALDGNRALIGAELANVNGNTNQGAAYVFERVGTTWTLQQRLLAAEPVSHLDHFGSSVAIDGDRVLVGAERAPIDGLNRHGAAYFFERRGSVWTEVQRVLASDGQAEGNFGWSAALRGDLALIGGNSQGPAEQGTLYVFRRVDGVWQETHQIFAPEDAGSLDAFGEYLAFDNGRAIAAHRGYLATGAAWVLREPEIFEDGFESGDTSAWSVTVGSAVP